MFVLSYLLCILSVMGQTKSGSITGKIIGKASGAPVDYATIMLFLSSDSSFVSGAISDSTGSFMLSNIDEGTYYLACSFVGYDKTYLGLTIDKKHRSMNIGQILVQDVSTSIEEVVISGQHSTYTQSIDKKTYTVGSDLMSKAGSAGDLLQNVPSVQVDIEGTISLRGNDKVLILIDGKPSVIMRGSTKSTILQQIPADQIERIEVITNPSAQYKPDGTSGIINIIMKKEHQTGWSGSIMANIGNQWRYNAGVSIAYTSPKISIAGNYAFRRDHRDRFTNSRRTITDAHSLDSTNITQEIISTAPSMAHVSGLNFSWNITDKNRLDLEGNYTYLTFPRNSNNTLLANHGQDTIYRYTRYRNNHERQQSTDGMAAFTHKFSQDKTFTIDYTYAMENEIENNHYQNIFSIPSDSVSKDNSLIKQRNYENLIRAIYEGNIGAKGKIVVGYEAELDRSDMRYWFEDSIFGIWQRNDNKSNDFIFNENVQSLYTTYGYQFAKFGFLIGIRAEQSFITSQLITLNQTIRNRYFLCYPSLHTSYKINEHNELQLNYTLRVNRPEGDDLNPFPEYQDPYNYRKGNPFLKPEKIHSFEAGWEWNNAKITLIITSYYRFTFNKMTEITKILDGNIVETTYENMSSSNAAGGEIVINAMPWQRLTLNFSSNLFYNQIDATDLGYSKKKGALACFFGLNLNATLFKNFLIQLNMHYDSPVLTPQGTSTTGFVMNAGIRYEIPHCHLSFTTTISDLFNSFRTITIDTPTLKQTVEYRRSSRTIYIGVSYQFGRIAKSSKQDIHYEEAN